MIADVDRLDDPRLDTYRHVADHRWLRERGLFVAEGRFVVERLIGAGTFTIHSVLVSPAARAALDTLLRGVDAPVYVAPQLLFSNIAGFNFHRGCLAIAVRPDARALAAPAGARLMLGLEGIGNPDNVGGLFRTAAAFGAGAVLLDEATGDPLYRKAIRTSMAAVLRVPFARVGNWRDAIVTLRERGATVVALTPTPTAPPLDAFDPAELASARVLLMVGSEGSGLSAEVLNGADRHIRIPMAGGTDSLNVTVAAGIALFRFARL